MEYGINVRFFGRDIGLEKAAELIAQAGFTQLDYVPYLLDEAWETSMKEAKAIFDAYGLTIKVCAFLFAFLGLCPKRLFI